MLNPMRLSELQEALNGRLVGADASFTKVSTDSRKIAEGELFIALRGPNFDGNRYLAEVASKGAVAALVSQEDASLALPQLVVADTRIALGLLGALNRQGFSAPVAAVTGSSGKTTVKEMLASILACLGPVLATRGNLNNDLGAPLTLLDISAEHRAAVIELGASGVGEIAYTVALARPDVAIITNAGSAHVGEFGGPEKIVEAKGEILEGLSAKGVAILNKDDQAFAVWSARAKGKILVSFAKTNTHADFYAQNIVLDAMGCPRFTLHSPQGQVALCLKLVGEHNVVNALAAAAAASVFGVSLKDIAQGLEALAPIKGRSVIKPISGARQVIDDSYNANPQSIKAAIDSLSHFSGRKVLVLGDMAELGAWSEAGHQDVGRYAVGKVDAFYAVGSQMRFATQAYGPKAQHFSEHQALLEALANEQQINTTFLIKGSRSAAMDKIVDVLCAADREKG